MLKCCILFLSITALIQAEPIKTPRHVYADELEIRIRKYSNHPGDYPFPTDMTFRKFADHSIDPTKEYFDPDQILKGDTVYVSDWYLPWFARNIHPKIKHPYILISNDSDQWQPENGVWDYDEKNGWPPPVDGIRALLYDSKLAFWFCKNMILSRHPKIIQIPIGQNIIYWIPFDSDRNYLLSLKENKFPKDHLLYMNMQLASNPVRARVASLFQDQPYCFSRIKNLVHLLTTRAEYYDDLVRSCYTPTPPGYGPDIVRLWESIHLGCIPIVKHCDLDDLYSNLPVLFVHEWEEVNEDLLRTRYEEIKKISKEKVYFDYWAELIKSYQKKVRNDDRSFSFLEATLFDQVDLENLRCVLKENISKGLLLYKGAVTGLRPFQIAKECSLLSRIYIQDQWGAWEHEISTEHLKNYTNHPLLKEQFKIVPINFYQDPYDFLKRVRKSKIHVFLDLSYRRHLLKEDLERAYVNSSEDTLIVGNCGNDSYVREVLDRFSKKYGLLIEQKGNIWHFLKKY